MKIALAFCRTDPEPSASNAAYIDALRALGAQVTTPRWNVEPVAAFSDADLVVLRQTWDYQADAAGYAAWLASLELAAVPVANPVPVVIWANDKRVLSSFEGRGVGIPATRCLDRLAPDAAMAEIGGERFVLKPAYGGSGTGVCLTRRETVEADLKALRAEIPGRPIMMQEFLPEIAEGEWSLIFIAGSFSHAVLKRPQAGEFRVNSRFRPEVLRAQPSDRVLAAARSLLDAVPMPLLYARIDGVLREGAFICTEVELTDPDIHLHDAPGSAERLVQATLAWAERRRAIA